MHSSLAMVAAAVSAAIACMALLTRAVQGLWGITNASEERMKLIETTEEVAKVA